ncbi:biotin carboxylase N-terminal domain-containing protein [Luteipulveratus mongoliensis]|uniref:Acetyl-CoA carboxylase subunit alpha n=1 Tax=Luteipulveratus mongoliensis TaxID=571913 RepID=A0A0K1JFN3_9MICO|nr:biotin carboxylase N-terminal domain-containing protein [Luteipulveratus mongoliensis]AKU15393.1 acetyl-CoA carboxylase subunit alpha [Luteipulveratus mongoliensis]
MRSVLVANRGEIARRVFRTCRDLGLSTVAVYSDADVDAPFVREADAAVRLPGTAPTDTYLRGELIVEAAQRAGADAVHPGYGFLSENADFARAVIDAGLTWIGPPPKAIDAMGSKIEAKRIMADAGVPLLDNLDPEAITESDLPVLVKASAGGGGRGMRVVRALADLPAELNAARAEAKSAFGDATVFCEPYIESGHHIEVQVMADRDGTVWAVGERECSIQRRHQKVVEEAPSPLVERLSETAMPAGGSLRPRPEEEGRPKGTRHGMREQLFDAAVKAAQAIGYEGAGTVEFLADDKGRFFFLEMNTRLQVEHPVTELTTRTDVVRLQIDVARGVPLPEVQPSSNGAAIEVRLYAEDPAQQWQPQSGTLHRFEIPGVRSEFGDLDGAGVRLDSGVESGSEVSVFYDPMLAKVISWAPRRSDAAAALAGALSRARIHGVRTNRDLLVRVLRHEAFLAGETDTAFFDTHGLAKLAAPLADSDAEALSAVAAALADAARRQATARVQPGLPSGWRNLPSQPQRKTYVGEQEHEVAYRIDRGRLRLDGRDDVTLISSAPDEVVLEVAGVRRVFEVSSPGLDTARPGGLAYSTSGAAGRVGGALAEPYRDEGHVYVDSALGSVSLVAVERFPDPTSSVAPGSLVAPLPGVVMSVLVAAGDEVTEGQPLLVLEAMKMQHTIAAPTTGVVTELPVTQNQHVEVGSVLAVVSPSGDDAGSEEPATPTGEGARQTTQKESA